MSKLSEEKLRVLNLMNQELLAKTGIDFLDRLTDLANNEKKTELDCHDFIKQNYPVKTGLTKMDHHIISTLVKFYLQKVDEHDAGEDQVCYGECQPIENDYYKPWRSRWLCNFISPNQRPSLVTGFFPKD